MKNIQTLLILFLGFNTLISAQVFDFVVDAGGSGTHTTVQAAIDACPDNVRKLIFVKNGTYHEKVMIGSKNINSDKKISLIGEDVDEVLIVWDDYNGKSITYDGSSIVSGTPQSATFTVSATDFYAENISIQNENSSAQAVALYTGADRQTFKNCKIIGFQDTHYSKKSTRSYYLKCLVEGGTDYICAGGTIVFESCTLNSVKDGSFITAPEDITAKNGKYLHGFVFKNCLLTTNDNVTVYLGRNWNDPCSSVFIDCKMESVKSEGWAKMNSDNIIGFLSTYFAEYNSKDLLGNALDVSSRVSWSKQLTASEVEMYYSNEEIFSHISAAYDPIVMLTPLYDPQNISISGSDLSWDAVAGTVGYVIYENDAVIGFSNSTSFADATPSAVSAYRVVSVSTNGALSDGTVTPTAISSKTTEALSITLDDDNVVISQPALIQVFNMSGTSVVSKMNTTTLSLTGLNKGIYIVRVADFQGNYKIKKIVLNK